jgi:hypothetical protein
LERQKDPRRTLCLIFEKEGVLESHATSISEILEKKSRPSNSLRRHFGKKVSRTHESQFSVFSKRAEGEESHITLVFRFWKKEKAQTDIAASSFVFEKRGRRSTAIRNIGSILKNRTDVVFMIKRRKRERNGGFIYTSKSRGFVSSASFVVFAHGRRGD